MSRTLAFIGILLLFSGCSPFSSSDNSELDDARARWVNTAITDYIYTLTVGCFCAEAGSYDLEVRGGLVVSVTPSKGGFSGGDDYVGRTIDELFGVLAQAYAQGADDIIVTYDAALGFPVTISIDYILDSSDDEIFYGVRAFERLN